MRNSLTFRLASLSLAWIGAALLATGLLLTHFYKDHIEQHYDAHVFSHLMELVAASSVDQEGRLQLVAQPSDPRFYKPLSGWYWEIREDGTTAARSESLGVHKLEIGHIEAPDTQHVHEVLGPGRQRLRLQALEFTVEGAKEPFVYLASAPIIPIASDVDNFASHIRLALLILGAGLLVAVLLQVRLALYPLKAIGSAISRVRAGREQKLPRTFPSEVQPLVDELNRLLEHNAFLLKRARNQLGDLAHSVKNPLSVINNEARAMPEEQRRLIHKQTHDISASVEHYLSRARTFGADSVMGHRTAVGPVAEDLAFVMRRVHQDKGVELQISGLDDCWFGGELADLEEMLGNLLDNAFKWASRRVWLHGEVRKDRLRLVVEDDGPGVPEQYLERIQQRGARLDEDSAGYGLGLAIVREVAELYGGTLNLGRSEHGGLRAELNLTASW